jgi:hypothetical protein
MNNFTKLKKQFNISEYTQGTENIHFTQTIDNIRYGSIYYQVTSPSLDEIFSVIPERYRNDFDSALMVINSVLFPHTDEGVNVGINFYVNTDPSVTQFYTTNAPSISRLENQKTTGAIYDPSTLTATDSFIAENTDAYILDITKIHSVIPQQQYMQQYTHDVTGYPNGALNNNRVVICLLTNKHSYADVVAMLEETGNV